MWLFTPLRVIIGVFRLAAWPKQLLHWTRLCALSLHLAVFRLWSRPNNFLHSEQVCVFSPISEQVRFQSWSLTRWLLALGTIVSPTFVVCWRVTPQMFLRIQITSYIQNKCALHLNCGGACDSPFWLSLEWSKYQHSTVAFVYLNYLRLFPYDNIATFSLE